MIINSVVGSCPIIPHVILMWIPASHVMRYKPLGLVTMAPQVLTRAQGLFSHVLIQHVNQRENRGLEDHDSRA